MALSPPPSDKDSPLALKQIAPVKSFTSSAGVPTRLVLPTTAVQNISSDLVKDNVLAMGGRTVMGVLEKWVNFGAGWQPRFFVLQGGVLSYYKVHGHHKATITEQRARHPDGTEVILIGEDTLKMERKEHSKADGGGKDAQALGVTSLQVATIRESHADDKKFYVHSGTKTLHLRAGSREEREQWLQELDLAKATTTAVSPITVSTNAIVREAAMSDSNSQPAASPVGSNCISSIRNRLQSSAVAPAVVDYCVSQVELYQEKVKALFQAEKHKRYLLLDYISTLEEEKRELESRVVKASTHQGDKGRLEEVSTPKSMHEDADSSSAEEEDFEGEFFDAEDALSPSSARAGHRRRVSYNELTPREVFKNRFASTPRGALTPSASAEQLPLTSPVAKQRRLHLPTPAQKEKAVSLWTILKENIGKDLTRVCLPVFFNEPLSALQKACEDAEYSHLLDKARTCQVGSVERLLHVAAFAVSGYASTDGRTNKPFNPLLGETYECIREEQGIRIVTEKTSHHPTIMTVFCEGRGWSMAAEVNVKNKFWGRSIDVYPVGEIKVIFDDGEEMVWSKVTTSIHNLIIGRLYVDHRGTMTIVSSKTKSIARLKFKEQGMMDRNPHQVKGNIVDGAGHKVASVYGRWSENLMYNMGDKDDPKHGTLLWERNPDPPDPTRYNLTAFAITLNELDDDLRKEIAPTDSRLRPDQRLLEEGRYDEANAEKQRLENKQRKARAQADAGEVWNPRWFKRTKEGNGNQFEYAGGYWEARTAHKWDGIRDIFGE
eukprot:jgi/Chlat1/8403/Chrsp80S07909